MELRLPKYGETPNKSQKIIINDYKREKWKIKKDKKYLFTLILFLVLIFLLILLLKANNRKNNKNKIIEDNIFITYNDTIEKYNWEDEKLIVHALGKYNNTIYTNSYEALNYWYYEKNMRLMEADFLLTKDNHIVLAHDFDHLKNKPTLKEFKQFYAKGYLTPMTFEDLAIFMKKNEDLFIITDTKYVDKINIQLEFDEMNEILSRYNGVKKRFIIEIYNEEMFLFLKEKKYNFKYFMFTLYKRWNGRDYKDLENIFAFCAKNKINSIIMYKHLFNSRINNLSKNYSIPVYLHTENSLIKIVEFLKNAKGIFTDAIDKIILNEYISNLTKLLL